MPTLAAYFARKSLDRLTLTPGVRQLLDKLLELCAEDHRANVARLHEALFPVSTPASANSALNRLIKTVNDAALGQRVPLSLCITADKKAGAANRWVWFDGPPAAPAPVYASELRAIPPGQLVTDQRGLPEGELPVVVLITFNKHETAAVHQAFHSQGKPATERRDGITYHLLGVHGGMRVVHLVSRQGEGQAQNAAHDAIRAWRPRAIIAVGIAFGVNPARQKPGDVLVSESVRGYELSRVNADGSLTLRSDRPPAAAVLCQCFNSLDHSNAADPDWPTLHWGTLLSGDKLVDNLSYRASLLKLESEAIGGEMEAVGIQLAADRHKVDWIIVKAICDWGDGNKHSKTKEQDQKTAAANAALVVRQALAQGNLYADLPGPVSPPPAVPHGQRPAAPLPPAVRRMNPSDRANIVCLIEDPRGHPATLKKDGEPEPAARGADQGVEVMAYLLQWVDQADAPPLFALLGEYGMGKTVTCQRLAEALEERRATDPTRPLPLYFDLRHVTGLDRRVPTLRETLEECMARGWLDAGEGYTLEHLHQWLAQGAVVILDGLDEVLVKLREADGQVFTRELLRLLPVAAARADAKAPLKLLISCRTQYFRTLRDQRNHFTGQERGEVRADAYRALVLLPLSEAQVTGYLTHALPEMDPQRLLATIRSVHNLKELTQRPYTLRLVAEFVPDIERDRMAGRTVYGVTLYRRMAQHWLERDQGKHHIRPEHKMRLAAHLAAHLWRSGGGSLEAGAVESWFHAWLEAQPDLRPRYARLHPDQLEEDLRTATFLARQDGEEGSSFRFAHTSLLEFFLAEWLLEAVRAAAPERWAMPMPSAETLDFLGQMLAEAGEGGLLATVQGWRTVYRTGASELLLAYALRARRKGWPVPLLRGIRLSGADLRGWVFDGRPEIAAPDAPALDLAEADFSGADLRAAVFDHVRLEGAGFGGARLEQANLLDCDAAGADWGDSACTAAIWRNTRLAGGRWQGAQGYGPRFIGCAEAPSSPAGLLAAQWAPLSLGPMAGRAGEAPALRWLTGHAGRVTACAFAPDGARLVSAGNDGTVRLWDARSGEALLTLHGHENWVSACAFAPDGARLASAGDDRTLRLWDARNGEPLLILRGHEGPVLACAFAPDGARLASAGLDGTLRLWDAYSGEALFTLRAHEEVLHADEKVWIRSCAFSPDGLHLASAGHDGTLRLWDARSGKALLSLRGHDESVRSCAFAPDGVRLASAGNDGTLRLWDTRNGEPLLTLGGHKGAVSACAFAPDGSRLASAGSDGTLRVWDAYSGEALLTLRGHKTMLNACAFAPDGARLASAGLDGTLRLWDARSGEALLTLRGHENEVSACAFAPDGARLTSVGDDGMVRLWNTHSGEALLTVHVDQKSVNDCAFASDGSRLASAGNDGTLRLWDARSGKALLTLRGHEGRVNACAFTPDGSRLVSAGTDGTLRLWDAHSAEALLTLRGHDKPVRACAFAPDGSRLASAGEDGTLRLWDAHSGEPLLTLRGHEGWVWACAFAPDGARLASAGEDRTLWLWDTRSGKSLLTLRCHDSWVRAYAFAPDGTRLASAGDDGTLRLWDAHSGEALLTLRGHEGRVNACAFAPDGARLASAGQDGTLRLWDAATGQLLRIHAVSARTHRGYDGHVVWDPADNRLIEACGDIWRTLAWVRPGPDGWPERLPLESFGPLPAPKRLVVRG